LQKWFDRFRLQAGIRSREVGFVFHVGPSKDDTEKILAQEDAWGNWAFVELLRDGSDGHVDQGRHWSLTRYGHMSKMRNELLEFARSKSPEFYLSCDSDMLLPRKTLEVLREDLGNYDGIAPLTFMTPPPTDTITNGMERTGSRFPAWTKDPRQVYACFGVVLMTPALMQVEYKAHGLGEDLGWAENVAEAKLRLAITPNVRVKHVMHPDHLEQRDPRVGF
jgi:hypothetical protein